MAGKVVSNRPALSFDFVMVEGDCSDASTLAASSAHQLTPWIDPSSIKLRHRIRRGPFGDVWYNRKPHRFTSRKHWRKKLESAVTFGNGVEDFLQYNRL